MGGYCFISKLTLDLNLCAELLCLDFLQIQGKIRPPTACVDSF